MCAYWRHPGEYIEIVLPSIPVHNPNGKSIDSAVFAQITTESLYTLQRAPRSPKITPSHGGSGPSSKSWFLGTIRASNPNGISIGSAVLQAH